MNKVIIVISALSFCMNAFGDQGSEPKYQNTVKIGVNEVSFAHTTESGAFIGTALNFDVNLKKGALSLVGGKEIQLTENGTLTPYLGGMIVKTKGSQTGYPTVGCTYLEKVHDRISIGFNMETLLGIHDHNPTFVSLGTPIVVKMGEHKNYHIEATPSTTLAFKSSQRDQRNGISFKVGRSF